MVIQVRGPIVAVRASAYGSTSANFDVWGLTSSGGTIYITGGRGFATRFGIGSTSSLTVTQGASTYVSPITLTTHYVQVSDCAVLIVFKMVNSGTSTVYVYLECDNDLYVDGKDSPTIYDISTKGFYMSGSTYGFTFIGKSYPLIRAVSTYWYGYYGDRTSNYWSSRGTSPYAGDGGCAFSWQSVSVPAAGVATVGALFRSGFFDSVQPGLSL
jgi:hypothetical protein